MKKYAPVGVMQGRLLPPVGDRIQAFPGKRWREEFQTAGECGLDLIEWIFDGDDWKSNPVWSDPQEIMRVSNMYGVRVSTLIADFFMDRPLVRASRKETRERIDVFKGLIDRASRIGIRYINVPFVDHSEIRNDAEVKEVVYALSAVLPEMEKQSMVLGLETSLDPDGFEKLLLTIDHPLVKVNYDIGNSAALGYDPKEEMDAYGEKIATVHVKDRVKGDGTVPLGSGDADFDIVFSLLGQKDFDGPIVLQAAREGDEIPTVKRYVNFLHDYLEKYF